MEVILKQDVDNLGQRGEVVRVASGYARNFLIPRDLAVTATAGNLKNLQDFIASAEKKRVAEREDAQALADKIVALEVKIEAKAGEKNRLFGSVTGQDIADVINAGLDLSIDKKKINTSGGIKTLGRHTVMVTVYPGLVVEKDIEVVAMAGSGEAEVAADVEAPVAEVIEESQESEEEVTVEEAEADVAAEPSEPHET
jgi:large subunit ribosomal protein L9